MDLKDVHSIQFWRVIFKYSQKVENNVSSSHIYSEVYSLNLQYGSSQMWEEGVQFFCTLWVFRNFPILTKFENRII